MRPRSVFSLTMQMPPQTSFLLTMWGPQIIFFASYVRAQSDHILRLLYGAPLISVSSHTKWRPPQINLFAYYLVIPSDQFLCILYGVPLRSVCSLTIGGPALRSVFSHTIWGPPRIILFAYYMGAP